MTISDLAYQILLKEGQSLHYKDIFAAISEIKEVKSSGSVQSCIYNEQKFIRLGEGYWGLTEWLLTDINFIYLLSPLQYQRGILEITPDYELFFPQFLKQSQITLDFKGKRFSGQQQNNYQYLVKSLYELDAIEPYTQLLIRITDLYNSEYEIVECRGAEEKFDLAVVKQQLADLAFAILKEQGGIMSSARILEQILIKQQDLSVLPPLSTVLQSDQRFRERISGMFTLNL
ncbi:MAG: hypothetical protein ACQEQI_06915 [Bacillota bacterium]